MPIRAGGETDEEARLRAQERTPRPATPTPTPSAPTPTPPPPMEREEADGAAPVETWQAPQPPEAPPAPPAPLSESGFAKSLSIKENLEVGFQFRFWRPERPASLPEEMPFNPIEEAERQELRFAEALPELMTPPLHIADQMAEGETFYDRLAQGSTEDINDMHRNLFYTTVNLQEYLKQYSEYDVVAAAKLFEKKKRMGAYFSLDMLNPTAAMNTALGLLAEEYPDNLTQHLATDAGFSDLMSLSVAVMMRDPEIGSAPPSLKFGDFDVLKNYSVGREVAMKYVEETVPDIPGVHGAVVNFIDLASDPIFIAASAVFPPAGATRKLQLATKFAVGAGIGEEAAEQLGVHPAIGMMGGGIVGIAGPGFFSAAMKNAKARARLNPNLSEPSGQLLVSGGELADDLGTLGAMGGSRNVYYRGITSDSTGAIREGTFLTPNAKDAMVYARASANQSGGRPIVQSMVVEEGAIAKMAAEEGLAAARGAVRVTNPGGVRVLKPGELPFPQLAGGSSGPSIQGFRQKINVHLERPESQDLLRKAAGLMAERVPVGVGQRLQEIINRMGLGSGDPVRKAGFGWQFQLMEDTAARAMSMARLGGSKVPFIENANAQIWIPEVAGGGARTLKTGFRRGKGEWIAGGDVAESLARGEKRYLGRLTDEQVKWFALAEEIKAPFVRAAEVVTKLKLQKLEAWWPRFPIDKETRGFAVTAGKGRGKPPALFARQFEEQQEAITKFGMQYRPHLMNQLDGGIESLQKITRDSLMGQYMKEEGILRTALRRHKDEKYADVLGGILEGVVKTKDAKAILELIGPSKVGPVTTFAGHVSDTLRIMLTGSLDSGWGAIQLVTMIASPAGPVGWSKAMGLSFYTMMKDPKFFQRYLVKSPGAKLYAQYGGDVSLRTEFTRAAEEGVFGLPRVPILSPILDIVTAPVRIPIRRLSIGMGSALAYGRIMAFEAMAKSIAKPGLLARAAGAKPLAGEALHEEMFRLVRVVDSMLGSTRMGGTITASQKSLESAYVFFAQRYTRSFFGTMAYMLGKGASPAQVRATMARLFIGGAMTMAGLITARGLATGKGEKAIIDEIGTALNPLNGKKFMSMEINKTWYGLGGVYRSMIPLILALGNYKNWDFETWEESLYENPIVRGWRGRMSPFTGQVYNLGPSLAGIITGQQDVSGWDYLGYEANISEMADDPRGIGADYIINNFAPITIDALLQGHTWEWNSQLPRFTAEFFGLRTSPETAFEALEPIMNRVAQGEFGMDYGDLEHNLPAQDYIRNHPDVVAVTEGRVRPIRERKQEKLWRKYREGRDAIRVDHVATRDAVEEGYVSGRKNNPIDGSAYRERLGESSAAEFFELRGYSAGLGIEFDDDDAEAGTVNAALEAYYNINLDDYRKNQTAPPDWEAFYADRDAALFAVPREYVALVDNWISRRRSDVRQHMQTQFDEVVTPTRYFQMREVVATGLELKLDDLETFVVESLQRLDQRASPGDVARVVDQILNHGLTSQNPDAPSISQMRQAIRERNPILDAELFRQGFTLTVRSAEAQALLVGWMESRSGMGYFEAPLAGNIGD